MFIQGLGTAVPQWAYTQQECWEALKKSSLCQKLTGRSQAILRKVLNGQNGIERRHASVESLAEAFDMTPDVLHARFVRHAPALAAEAARKALADAEVEPGQIDGVIISTCTGYLCPGLTSYVSERLGLPAEVQALDLVGQGCGAALPNLRTADALVASGQCQRVLSICVEVCSAAFYLDDDPGVLISTSLFGDGAGAAVLSLSPNPGRRIEWKGCCSLLQPEHRDLLRFEQKQGMLRNRLGAQVPALAAVCARQVLERGLAQAGLARSDIRAWIFHPGGRDVLRAICEGLELAEADVCWSAGVLRDYGNLSSPSVFFVLQSALAGSAADGPWWMSSFGAGFSCYGALIEVQRQ